jgi:hypothetical protein
MDGSRSIAHADSRLERSILDDTGQPSQGSLKRDIFAREPDLNDERRKFQFYCKKQLPTLSRQSNERMSLRDAATTLDEDARNTHPRLPTMLGDRCQSLSIMERMALLLLEYLQLGISAHC